MDYSLYYISPEVILGIGGLLVLLIGLASRAWTTPKRLGIFSPEVVGLFVLALALIPTLSLLTDPVAVKGVEQFSMVSAPHGLFVVDGFAIAFKLIALISTALVILLSVDFFRQNRFHRGEYYSLLIFATLAITALAASTDMIMIYLSLEFLSITSYILAGYLKRDIKSNEAAIKYFIYGSVAAAVMIYGMSMLYGLTGTTSIYGIAYWLRQQTAVSPLVFISALMVLVGLGFKIALVPFHQWSPDTYEGAPTPITAFLSVGSKAAGFAVLMRVLVTGITVSPAFDWTPLIIVLSAITMTVGNLVAIPQTNIKRMLAYSSIAHAGYLLVGVAALGATTNGAARGVAVQAVLIYLFAYMFMNLGAFAVATLIGIKLKSNKINDYAGLAKRAPWASAAMVFFMLSLAGIPPTAGFLGKFYLFYAAIQTSQQTQTTPLLWLALVAIINSVISVYYYFNVVRVMYFGKATETAPADASPTRALGFVIVITMVMTVLILIFSQTFVDLAAKTATMLSGV